MSEIIESLVSEAIAASENQAPEAVTETPQEVTETPEEPPVEAPRDDSFPKKAVNAISRRDKMIGKLRAELAAERAKSAAPQKSEPVNGVSPTLPNGEPNPDFYQTYDELNKARIQYEAGKTAQQIKIEQKESFLQEVEDEHWQEREAVADAAAAELVKTTPEFAAVIQQNAQVIQSASLEVRQLILDADNPALALFNLVKEGKFAQLSQMPLARAAMEVGRASALAISPPKTKAPAPLPASRGSVPATKPLEKYTHEEAHALLTKRN